MLSVTQPLQIATFLLVGEETEALEFHKKAGDRGQIQFKNECSRP